MSPEQLIELMKTRRSVMPVQYSNENISKEELDLILESANWAPNHKRTEPWRFVVIEERGINRFAEFLAEKYLANTPIEAQSERKKTATIEKALLSNKIILINLKVSNLLPEWEELAATSMAVQNMWLMCTALGIGSYWSSPGTIVQMNEFIPLDENEKCIGIFYMGKLNSPLLDSSRKPISDKITFVKE